MIAQAGARDVLTKRMKYHLLEGHEEQIDLIANQSVRSYCFS